MRHARHDASEPKDPMCLFAAAPVQLTWTTIFIILAALAAIVLGLWGLGRILRRLFPSSGKYRTAGGNALLRGEALFRPSREHIIEAKEHEEKEDETSGDPVDPTS